jgi:hypothetical protein
VRYKEKGRKKYREEINEEKETKGRENGRK